MKRFEDRGHSLYHFSYLFLVRCPRCDGCAEVVLKDRHNWEDESAPEENLPYLFAPRRLACSHCGYNKDYEKQEIVLGEPVDWYFRLPLWLQTPCCGKMLWAINREQLDYLEEFVGAFLREAYPNRTMASRLPKWMKIAKNREAVLKSIRKLRNMLP